MFYTVFSLPCGLLDPRCRKMWPDSGKIFRFVISMWYCNMGATGSLQKTALHLTYCYLSDTDCGGQAKRSAGAGQSAHATWCPTSRTAGGGWRSKMPGRPAGWMEASCSASRGKASSSWLRGSYGSCRREMETSGSGSVAARSTTGPGQ